METPELSLKELENKLFLGPLTDLVAKLNCDRRLKQVWLTIQLRYADGVTLAEAADHSGISKDHLNVLLRQRIGLTFCQLLIRYRLSKALALMFERKANGSLEVAVKSGFADSRTFQRHFIAVFGQAPRNFLCR